MVVATGNGSGLFKEYDGRCSEGSDCLERDDEREGAGEGAGEGESERETGPGPDDIARWLEELRVEHRDLDDVIEYLEQTGHPDRMKLRRLKKRKLKLKDTIARLESRLIPDLDA